ncbi:MAG: arginine--tRNA ligase, partial [Candidatus Aenigmatarchaeota archaeon]
IMGEALSRILESQGWSVKRFCYINDMGRQAAALMLGYQMNFSNLEPDKKPDVWLGDIYFKINQSIEEDPTLEEKLEEMLRAYETGDKDIRSLGKRIFGWCLNGFRENWRLLGIKFDKIMWESEFISESREIVESIKRAGLTSMSDGALVLKLEDHGLPNTILLRTGGTGLYLTRDIACTMWKFKNYKPDLNVWVVAEDQKLHFQQQLKTLELLGQTDIAAKSVHLAYSMVLLEGRKMSARKGWMVLWDELLDEGTKRAAEEVEKRWPELSPAEKQRRARSIALAAIVYFMLKYAPEKIVNFSWDAALAFEGDTGPYLQYTYARAASILRKAKVKRVGKFDSKLLKDPKEIVLLKLLAQYPTTLSKSARDLRPHYLAGYLFNLADAFNQFYQALPVIRADKPLRSARLKLVEATKTVLKNGLELLAIATPEKM